MRKNLSTRRLFFVNNIKGNALNKSYNLTCNIVLRASEKGLLSKESLEAARKAIKKIIKKSGQIVIRANAFLPLTSKPSEVRMGKGKGKISAYVCPVKAGHILFELRNVDEGTAKKAFLRAAVKLAIHTNISILRDTFSFNVPLIK
jgi:large subunit ribosomal protein L16